MRSYLLTNTTIELHFEYGIILGKSNQDKTRVNCSWYVTSLDGQVLSRKTIDLDLRLNQERFPAFFSGFSLGSVFAEKIEFS